MRYLGWLKILVGRPRFRAPLRRRAARAAKNCCPNPALRRACPSTLNLGCPISKSGHVPDNDCIKVVDVGNKHMLNTLEGADQEGTGDVSIHGACYGIGECSKAEHILHSTDFLRGKPAINLGTCGNDYVGLHVTCEGCIGLVPLHVSLVGSGQMRQIVFD